MIKNKTGFGRYHSKFSRRKYKIEVRGIFHLSNVAQNKWATANTPNEKPITTWSIQHHLFQLYLEHLPPVNPLKEYIYQKPPGPSAALC
jgi:hypothetical protein